MADGLVHCVEEGGWYPTIRNGDSFVNGVSSIDSNIINFGNGDSCCIFSLLE